MWGAWMAGLPRCFFRHPTVANPPPGRTASLEISLFSRHGSQKRSSVQDLLGNRSASSGSVIHPPAIKLARFALKRFRASGFTLVELLVVIAIIGILVQAALLDRSVRSVTDSIDLKLWHAAGTRSGREVLGEW
ncbi:hypothetical protein Mal15_02320 [Stieleria maiorica]|uniref:Prepilin-type N-terminal cleavage/methylation domain-containing protein n=1 Tax=Stieleria maiorica TaxID=2795974 RepID=A0A5B9M9D0_9BACT|nr:type II secretion system protein [Stieleria maiorica]QEF96205.1 hypothetical protein Mal15_02320 [Stieleria maiorica]